MNEKSFPMIAGLVALLLVVLLVLSMFGGRVQESVQTSGSVYEQTVPRDRGNTVGQTVQLPIPIPSSVTIKP